MNAQTVVRYVGEIICGIYATIPAFWMAVHPFAARWRERRLHISRLGWWWVALWVVAWLIELPFRDRVLYAPRWWMWIVAAACWSISIIMYKSGGRALSLTRVIGRHEIENDRPQELVTNGIYARVRNPLYTGHLCTLLGWSVVTGATTCWACTAFYLATLMIMLPQEERELSARFGQQYEEYKRRVPRLIPKISGS